MSEDKENKNLPTVIRSECHFLEFPFFALSRKGLRNKKEIVFRYEEIREAVRGVFEWRVLPSAKYGCPSPFDRRVMRAVDAVMYEKIKREGYPVKNPIEFSVYQLTDLMGYSTRGGKIYRDVRNSLRRIKLTGVESVGTFFLKDKKRWIYDIFNIYDRVLFKGDEGKEGETVDTNYLWLGDFVLRNINSQHVRPLNYIYLAGLKSDIAGRLYEILSGKFYSLIRKGGGSYNIDYLTLCQLLPITPQKYLSKVKEKLKPAHEELIKTDFLYKVDLRKSKNGFVVVYYLGKRAEELTQPALMIDVDDNQKFLPFLREENESIQLSELGWELHERGLSLAIAMQFCQKHTDNYLHQKMEMFDFLRNTGSKLISNNPAGWLRRAIEEDWQPTEDQKKSKEIETYKSQEQERQVRWLQHREELIQQDISNWDTTTPEKRVQGRLNAWIITQSRPNQDKIENKLQEFIDSLPKTDEEKREYIARNYAEDPPSEFE